MAPVARVAQHQRLFFGVIRPADKQAAVFYVVVVVVDVIQPIARADLVGRGVGAGFFALVGGLAQDAGHARLGEDVVKIVPAAAAHHGAVV